MTLLLTAWVVLAIPAATWATTSSWNVLYDDAFISFRYAKNLAAGFGLAWNPGEAPTEGFTNLLLVLMIAGTGQHGLDPLILTRILSGIALVGTSALIAVASRQILGVSRPGSWAIGLAFLIVPSSALLTLSGMETMLFCALLVSSVLSSVLLTGRPTVRRAVLYAVVTFAAYLTRPEGALAAITFAIVLASVWRRLPSSRWLTILGLAGFFVLATAHLVWRLNTFGGLLPNPYFLKSTSVFLTPSGLGSVVAFLSTFTAAVLAALVSIAFWHRLEINRAAPNSLKAQVLFSSSAALSILYLIFIVRTDTITDIAGRFTFPILPFVLIIGALAVGRLVDALVSVRGWPTAFAWGGLLVGFALLSALPLGTVTTALSPTFLRGASESMAKQLATNSQLRLADAFVRVADDVPARVAYGDAGLVPYKSELPWLDLVGLNDTTLARATDLTDAVKYVFRNSPDVMLIPREQGGELFSEGHGILGNYASWARDAGWADYEYLGTFERIDAPYDLLVLVRSRALPTSTLVRLQVDLGLWCSAGDAELLAVNNGNECN